MRKMPEDTSSYLHTNDSPDLSPKKRMFSRRNQHYMSHLAAYDLEEMIKNIEPKYEPKLKGPPKMFELRNNSTLADIGLRSINLPPKKLQF